MLGYVVTFLLVAIAAGILGFSGISATATWIAQVAFIIALVTFFAAAFRRPSL